MKRILSLLLAAALVLGAAAALSGCASAEYPADIANITIEKEPENIVVLDANTADIIAFMGLDGKIVGRSDQVDQQALGAAPSVGGSSNPSVSKIKESDAAVVFAPEAIQESAVKELEESGIKVIKMSFADTPKQLLTNYKTIGKILCGQNAGEKKGEESYKKLIDELEAIQSSIPVADANPVNAGTVCYLYYEDSNLKIMTRDTYGEMLLEYTNCTNVAGQITEAAVDVQVLNTSKPNYIFYSDQNALKAIKSDSVLSKLPAVKNNNMLQITESEMKRQGSTAVQTVKRMVDFVYKGKNSAPEEPVTNPSAAQSTTQPATKAEQATTAAQTDQQTTTAAQENQQTTAATQADNTAANTSVAAQYKINLTDLSLKKADENANVKIMQKRLYDLGYITGADNVTGYYGDVSEKAIKEFQQANGITANGTATHATLVKLFDNTAKKKA